MSVKGRNWHLMDRKKRSKITGTNWAKKYGNRVRNGDREHRSEYSAPHSLLLALHPITLWEEPTKEELREEFLRSLNVMRSPRLDMFLTLQEERDLYDAEMKFEIEFDLCMEQLGLPLCGGDSYCEICNYQFIEKWGEEALDAMPC